MGGNFGQSVNGGSRPRSNTSKRPATAMSNRAPESDTSTGSQCTNTPDRFPLSSKPLRFSSSVCAKNEALFNPRLRPRSSAPSLIPVAGPHISTRATSRDSSLGSLTSKFGHMTISEEVEEDGGSEYRIGGQVNSASAHLATPTAIPRPGPRPSKTTVRPGRRDKVDGQ